MKERLFKFKQFSVRHSQSAMKVGVDGVLIGAWASCEGARILDVGCGCGLIALMLAQRNMEGVIDAIDVDTPSLEEASLNVASSPWPSRINVEERSFDCILEGADGRFQSADRRLYDLIVSNPPFFDAGVLEPLTPRERSRHQGSLSPSVLVKSSGRLLKEGGRLALIAPADMSESLRQEAECGSLSTARICYVRDNATVAVKRVMMEFIKRGIEGEQAVKECEPVVTHLTLFEKPGEPTPEYRALCRDFYLKF